MSPNVGRTPAVRLVARPGSITTGTTRYSDNLCTALQAAGWDVGVSVPELMPGSARARRALRRIGMDADSFFSIYPLRARLGPGDIYHLTPQTMATLLMLQRFDHPVVVTVMDILPYWLRNDPRLNTLRHPVDGLFYRLALAGLKRADALIAFSHWTRHTLIDALGIPPGKIHVRYPGVNVAVFRPGPVPREFKQQHGLDDAYRYILYVGSEQPRKNFLTLVRAFARLRRKLRDVRLLKVGEAESTQARQQALELISALGLEREVQFCGHAGADLPMFYRASALFVFPSYFEGFGLPPLEAMACGVPVICSQATSLPEVVGDAALLFQPDDDIALAELMEQMLLDPALREQHIQLGLRRVSAFSWTATAQATIGVYQRLIRRSSMSARAPFRP